MEVKYISFFFVSLFFTPLINFPSDAGPAFLHVDASLSWDMKYNFLFLVLAF